MADIFGKEQRSYIMSRVKSKDTKPEKTIRRLIWALGFRYRLHKKELPGTPDIVLSKMKKVIFVNGCFWHGHSCRTQMPKSNSKFWLEKILKNKKRDKSNLRRLQRQGWSYLVIWECAINATTTVKRIQKFLSK